MKNLLVAEIIPAVDLPRHLGIFDYAINLPDRESLAIGQLVQISFRSRPLVGVVHKLKSQPSVGVKNLKPIQKMVPEAYLHPYQMDLLRWMAAYYFQSPALILKAMLPKIPAHSKPATHDDASLVVNNANQGNKPGRIQVYTSADPLAYYLKNIYQIISQGQQVCVIFPTQSQAENFFSLLQTSHSNIPVTLVTGNSSIRYNFSVWQSAQASGGRCFIGTKKTIFLPFLRLGLIIVDSENDPSHKQWDSNPRYHVRDVASHIAHTLPVILILQSTLPSAATFSKTYKGAEFVDHSSRLSLEIIDFKNSIRNAISPIFTDAGVQAMTGYEDRIIVIHSTKGAAAALTCNDCQAPVNCPTCHNPLALTDTHSHQLLCRHCLTQSDEPTSCPNCGSSRLRLKGLGTQSLITELKKIFPNRSIGELTAETKLTERNTLLKAFLESQLKILITTTGLFHELAWLNTKPQLIIIPQLESFLAVPEYTNTEKTAYLLCQAASLANQCVVQTHNPSHRVFLALKNQKLFYRSELAERKLLRYPPFSRLVALIIQDKNSATGEKRAQSLADSLTQAKEQLGLSLEILGPTVFYRVRIRGFFRFYVILRVVDPQTNLSLLIRFVPENTIIDVDPIDLA